MNIQSTTTPAKILTFFVATPDDEFTPMQPICASSRDYSFDFDEEEVACELFAPLPASLVSQADYEVEADEFEGHYLWLLI